MEGVTITSERDGELWRRFIRGRWGERLFLPPVSQAHRGL